MNNAKKPVSFGITVPTIYGPVIVNRHDTIQTNALIKSGRSVSHREIVTLCNILRSAPDEVVCLDIGSNYGLYGLAFARALSPKKGLVHAFEAQRVLAYMAAGTAMLNGIENLFVHHQAVGSEEGRIAIPQFNYNKKISSFGSIEFGDRQEEFIGQSRHYQSEKQEYVDVVSLDSLKLDNVYLIKIDVEGMEEAVLNGAKKLIEHNKPFLCVEYIKSDKQKLFHFCKEIGYRVFEWGGDLLCIHPQKQFKYSNDFNLKEL